MPYFERLFENASEGDSSSPIIGHLPEWVKERQVKLIYNGPVGKWDFEKETANTWFDGMSLLMGFYLDKSGELVRMRKRYLKSLAFEKAEANGQYIITEYGTPGRADPEKGLIARTLSSLIPGEMTDNCACSVFQLQNGLTFATTETALLRQFDVDTLETSPDKCDLSSKVNIISGRPLRDPITGDIYNIAATFLTGLKYHFVKFNTGEAALSSSAQDSLLSSMSVICSIPSRMKTCFGYYHSFGMTEQYLIFIEQPWVANSMKLLSSKVKGQSLKDCLEWYPEERNLFHIVNKKTGVLQKVKYLSQEPFFLLNHVNAYDDKERKKIVVDVIGYDSPDMLKDLSLEQLRTGSLQCKDTGKLMRFELPMVEDDEVASKAKPVDVKAAMVVPGQSGCEHPMVNRNFLGSAYQYAYVIGWMASSQGGFYSNAITKVNMSTGDCVAWRGDEFSHPSEPVFIPRDFLLFLDARNMTEVARATFDEDIPFAGHAFALMQ